MNENETIQAEAEQNTGTGPDSATDTTGTTGATYTVDPATGEPIEGITEEEWDELITLLTQVKENTQSVQPITVEQGNSISQSLDIIENGFLTVIFAVFIVFVFRWIYRLISGWFA